MDKSKVHTFIIFSSILTISIYALFISDSELENLQKHYKNCEYEKSILLADEIIKNPRYGKIEKTESYKIKAISEFSTQRYLDSQITFTELLYFNENIQLSPEEISPKILNFFSEIRNSMNKSNTINKTKG